MKKSIIAASVVGLAAMTGVILWLGHRAAKEFDYDNDEWITPFVQKKEKYPRKEHQYIV